MSLTSLTQTKEIIAANLVDDTPHRQQGDRRLMLTQPRPRDGPKNPPPPETNHILESQIHHFPGLDPHTARTPPRIVGRVRCFMDVCLQLIPARYRQVPFLNRDTRSTDISNMKVDIPCLWLRSQL